MPLQRRGAGGGFEEISAEHVRAGGRSAFGIIAFHRELLVSSIARASRCLPAFVAGRGRLIHRVVTREATNGIRLPSCVQKGESLEFHRELVDLDAGGGGDRFHHRGDKRRHADLADPGGVREAVVDEMHLDIWDMP